MKTLTPAKMVMFVFVAIGMLITFYLVKTLTAKEPPRRITTRNVPLTLTELVPGTVIKEGDIGLGPAPANEIVGDVLLSVDGLIGRVVKNTIPVTELIHGSNLYPTGQLPPLKVVDGATAFTIPQSETAAMVEGLIKPGDHVDIYYSPQTTTDARYEGIGNMTIKLFKGVRVIAINQSFVQDATLTASSNSVTVEIRKDDAALLQLASNTGDLTLSYTRDGSGQATVQVADPDRPTLEELLQLPPVPEESKEPDPNRFTTNVWRKGSRQTRSFVNGVPTRGRFDFDQYAPRVPGAASGNGQPGYGPPGGPGGSQPNGVWSPQLTPQPGSLPQGPPPGQEQLNPGAGR